MSKLRKNLFKKDYQALLYSDIQSNDYVLVDWSLGNICNYSCSYCPKRLHDSSFLWHDFDSVISTINILLAHYKTIGKKCIFQFTGGEVTLCPYLLDALKHIKKYGGYTSIISNSSKDLLWWKQSVGFLDNVIFTYHAEFVRHIDFTKKACFLSQKTDVYVCVTIDSQFFQARKWVVEEIKKSARKYGFTVFAKPLFVDFGTELYTYTKSQKEYIKNASYIQKEKHNHVPARNMCKQNNMNSLKDFKMEDAILKQENSWLGWNCDIGLNLITIRFDGSIYRGQCEVGGKLGNIFQNDMKLPDDGIQCTKSICNCLSDIMVPKYKV